MEETEWADGCDVVPGPCVDARGTCPVGEGAGCATDVSTVAQLTSGVSGERSESAARRG